MRTTSLGLTFLLAVDVIKTWLLHEFYMLRFYNLITMKKTLILQETHVKAR